MSKFAFPCLIGFLVCILTGCGPVQNRKKAEPSPRVVEERGIWLNRSDLFGPKQDLLRLLDDLAKANFTSVYIDTYFRGAVIYPDSALIPQFEGVSEPDVLEWLIPEIKKRGLRAEAWVEYGFYAYHVPDATKTDDRGTFLNKYPELTAVASDGTLYLHNAKWGDFYSFCPANPASHQLLADLFVEMLMRYPFDGLNLDRIRFPNEHFCFCDYCKQRFQNDAGLELKPFLKGTDEYKTFVKWRKKQLDRFMETAVPRFRRARPGITVSLASLPPEMMDSHAQGWDVWLQKGLIDAAMPMLYGESGFEDRVEKISRFPRWDRIFPGLDAHGLPPEAIIKQIEFCKTQGSRGFAIWYSGQVKDDLPLLEAGPFAKPAVSPLDAK